MGNHRLYPEVSKRLAADQVYLYLRVARYLALFALSLPFSSLGRGFSCQPPWQAMDYAPFLSPSIEAPEPTTNIAYKGIAMKFGASFGGDHNEAVDFDTDLLRYSAGWTGEFVALKGVAFDGEHWAYPPINGLWVFGNPAVSGRVHALCTNLCHRSGRAKMPARNGMVLRVSAAV